MTPVVHRIHAVVRPKCIRALIRTRVDAGSGRPHTSPLLPASAPSPSHTLLASVHTIAHRDDDDRREGEANTRGAHRPHTTHAVRIQRAQRASNATMQRDRYIQSTRQSGAGSRGGSPPQAAHSNSTGIDIRRRRAFSRQIDSHSLVCSPPRVQRMTTHAPAHRRTNRSLDSPLRRIGLYGPLRFGESIFEGSRASTPTHRRGPPSSTQHRNQSTFPIRTGSEYRSRH